MIYTYLSMFKHGPNYGRKCYKYPIAGSEPGRESRAARDAWCCVCFISLLNLQTKVWPIKHCYLLTSRCIGYAIYNNDKRYSFDYIYIDSCKGRWLLKDVREQNAEENNLTYERWSMRPGVNFIMRSFVICALQLTLLGWLNEEGWDKHVCNSRENRKCKHNLDGNPQRKKPRGRSRCMWYDNIKIVDWIQLAQDMLEWQTFVNTVSNLSIALKQGNPWSTE